MLIPTRQYLRIYIRVTHIPIMGVAIELVADYRSSCSHVNSYVELCHTILYKIINYLLLFIKNIKIIPLKKLVHND